MFDVFCFSRIRYLHDFLFCQTNKHLVYIRPFLVFVFAVVQQFYKFLQFLTHKTVNFFAFISRYAVLLILTTSLTWVRLYKCWLLVILIFTQLSYLLFFDIIFFTSKREITKTKTIFVEKSCCLFCCHCFPFFNLLWPRIPSLIKLLDL